MKQNWFFRTKILVLAMLFVILRILPASAQEVPADMMGLTSPSAILMEASTGSIIYEKDADQRKSPASITKLMTALLIFEALDTGRITLADEVITSAFAKSMGGSQVYLEEGEKQTVDTLLKCILVASGNDASVAMAEYIAGTEESFVVSMNEKARELGLQNTHFCDCSGLSDSDEHYTSARDVAIIARQLLTRYPQVKQYTTIWMENIVHETAQGRTEFGLANTNKLIKQYPYATGLKTGSTQKAKYCLCATAYKDGIELIAVVMGCPEYKKRFPEAQTLLQYGYSTCRLYRDNEPPELPLFNVKNGEPQQVSGSYAADFSYLSTDGESFSEIEKKVISEPLTAPLEEGQRIGYLAYYNGEKLLGQVEILSKEAVREAGYPDYLKRLLQSWLPGDQ